MKNTEIPACNMLSSADIPIMEISFSVGFHNFSYFIRKFKEITGFTPTGYREQLNKLSTSNIP